MFEPSDIPRIFTLPVGVDFSHAFIEGLKARLHATPPHEWARIEIYVNTQRTARRLRELFLESGAAILPRIRLLTDLANDHMAPIDLPPAVPKIRRRLQLAQLVNAVLEKEKTLAPQSAVFDLADALAELLDEFQGEAIPFEALKSITLENQSDHWDRTLRFLQIIADHWDEQNCHDANDRLRQVAQAYSDKWRKDPPDHPIIIAGSTGSRGHTAVFMNAVAKLPQGCVVLPGVDQHISHDLWEQMAKGDVTLDHPQAGIARLYARFGISQNDAKLWVDKSPASVARNKLISLAMRPAPVTNVWRTEGRNLKDSIATALMDVDLISAPGLKEEALAIATRLRKAAEDGQTAVLISPDRTLTRRVESCLKRWSIIPDDSAGQPLALTPPGVFLRLVAECLGRELTPDKFMAVAKHPLAHSTLETRGDHIRRTSEVELNVLRGGPPSVDFAQVLDWAQKQKNDPTALPWAGWLQSCFNPLEDEKLRPLSEWLELHINIAEQLSAGQGQTDSGELWLKDAGEEADTLIKTLKEEAGYGGIISASDYRALLKLILADGDVRKTTPSHPHISIWGTLEARVQGAELVILGGLTEGTWPKPPTPDPWLNRTMRAQVGLPLPERQIGLSAHDFQQAVAAPKVVLSYAKRDADAPTIPSRWILRLSNLLNGLGDDIKAEYSNMLNRGDHWLALASLLDLPEKPIARATRPSPKPPAPSRPKKLSVTNITKLVRDPYAIYAKYILKLNPLEDLGRAADARLRGTIIHKALEHYVDLLRQNKIKNNAHNFNEICRDVIAETTPWPLQQHLWQARLARIAETFVKGETERQKTGRIAALETRGEYYIPELEFTLHGTADRIDVNANDALNIYDYKSGNPPSKKVLKSIDKQLQLEAIIAMHGGFADLQVNDIAHLEYIGLGGEGKNETLEDITPDSLSKIYTEFCEMITVYQSANKGYTSRDKSKDVNFAGDYDHLARFGEWDDSDQPDPQVVP